MKRLRQVIRGFFDSDAVSPKFVRRVLEEYGDEFKAGMGAEGVRDLLKYNPVYLFAMGGTWVINVPSCGGMKPL